MKATMLNNNIETDATTTPDQTTIRFRFGNVFQTEIKVSGPVEDAAVSFFQSFGVQVFLYACGLWIAVQTLIPVFRMEKDFQFVSGAIFIAMSFLAGKYAQARKSEKQIKSLEIENKRLTNIFKQKSQWN